MRQTVKIKKKYLKNLTDKNKKFKRNKIKKKYNYNFNVKQINN